MPKLYLFVFISATVTFLYVAGHGMVLDPVNRCSRWRYDSKAKPNYDDSQGWCGGFYVSALLCDDFLFLEELLWADGLL